MASITIRNLDDDLKRRLRMQAAANGRSMEEEVRGILRTEVGRKRMKARATPRSKAKPMSLLDAIRKPLEPLGFVDLPTIKREPIREPPTFD